jgi:hypothetical protein
MDRSKKTGRTCPLLARKGLVTAFLAAAGGVGVAQSARADGIVRCWGDNYYGECDTPADLGPCSSVAGGGYYTIALRRDGGVRCWGLNDTGECNTPADLGACSSVAGGPFHTIAIETPCPQCPSSLTGNCIAMEPTSASSSTLGGLARMGRRDVQATSMMTAESMAQTSASCSTLGALAQTESLTPTTETP